MTIGEIYQLAIKMGIDADPRGKDGVKKYLNRQKKIYDDLPKSKKDEFDLESLTNPFSDTRLLYGDPAKKVKKVIAGIDVDTGEVVLTDRLNQKGENIDLMLAHHPAGGALISLHEVMDVQAEHMHMHGVPIHIAEGIMSSRIGEVARKFGPLNHFRSVDAARLLDIPFICIHTAWDNMSWKLMADIFENKEFDTIGDVMKAVKQIPEIKEVVKYKAGPTIFNGSESRRAGKIMVLFTGGTDPGKEVIEKISGAGVGTLITMHVPEEHIEEAKKYHINIINTGHMASDSIGANLFLDELERQGVSVISTSGLIRVKRIGRVSRRNERK